MSVVINEFVTMNYYTTRTIDNSQEGSQKQTHMSSSGNLINE